MPYGRQLSEVNAESVASLEYTSEALRMGVSPDQRYKIVRQFRRRARTEQIIK